MLHDLKEGNNVDVKKSQDSTRQVRITCHTPLYLISN